jgi:protein phosphatase
MAKSRPRRSDTEPSQELWNDESGFYPRYRSPEQRRDIPEGAIAYGLTDRGCVRRNNEDQFLIATFERSMSVEHSSVSLAGSMSKPLRQGLVLMVSDGMGGYEGGEVASNVIVQEMADYCFGRMPWLRNGFGPLAVEIKQGLKRALEECLPKVRQAALERRLDQRMGATFTMAYVEYPRVYVMHAGDSRCYLEHAGAFLRLTRDHTVAQQMVDESVMSEADAARSPYRHVLLNAVGGETDDIFVDVHLLELEQGDQLLLCSDGLTSQLTDSQIRRELAGRRKVADTVGRLVDAAKQAGGDDNITVVLARFQ